MRGLYAIADVATLAARRVDVVTFSRAVLAARPVALQLRAKDLPAREMLSLLRALSPMCRAAGVPLVANDRVDVAALAGCDYVHIGQEDLPFEMAHRIAPALKVGVSTHTIAQLRKALEQKPSYVAYGPIFATSSKAGADPVVGLAGLAAAFVLTRAAGIPLVAIGGITLERASGVAEVCDAAAVIAALIPEDAADPAEITLRARRLHAALSRPLEITLASAGVSPAAARVETSASVAAGDVTSAE
jgi:thiamine-phosphate pyrophosphorylase